MDIMTHGKNSEHREGNSSQRAASKQRAAPGFCGVSWPREICPIVEALVGFVQARCGGEQDGQAPKAQTFCCHQGSPPAGLCKPGLTKYTKKDGECMFVEGHHSE